MKLPLISVLFAVALAACDNNTLKTANAKKTASNTPEISNAQINLSSNQSTVKIGQSTGLITKINLEIGSVELKHDEIKGMMPAMQMEFYVTNKAELEKLKIGDKALFTLEENQGSEKITKISKIE